MAYKEYFVYTLSQALTASATGIAFDPNTTRIDSDADFEFQKTTYVSGLTANDSNGNDRVNVRYRDDSQGRYLLKDPLDIKMIAGRNTLLMGLSSCFIPFIWPRPYVISAGTTFTVEMADYSNAGPNIRLAFHGAKVRPGQAPWDRRFRATVPFVYGFAAGTGTGFTSGLPSIAASSTKTVPISIDIDSHFLVQKIVAVRTGDALVSINEGARGRDWTNAAIHIDNLCGNGAFPNIMFANRFIFRGSVVNFNIQNLLGIANVIDIALIGTKLYE